MTCAHHDRTREEIPIALLTGFLAARANADWRKSQMIALLAVFVLRVLRPMIKGSEWQSQGKGHSTRV
jgi:hypothetical protein